MQHTLVPIGIIHSCFKEKFGIPRQPGLVPEARANLELLPPFDREEALRGLEQFSHLWILFVFHGCPDFDGKLTVRPPRLGGNERLGVFATRGTHRPNPIGMSVVELEGIVEHKGRWSLKLKGADLLDGTPILDIKPYLPYADSLPQATGGFAEQAPAPELNVDFTEDAEGMCTVFEEGRPGLRQLITSILGYDPRPGYRRGKEDHRSYAMKLYDLDVHWKVQEGCAVVHELRRIGENGSSAKDKSD